MKINEILIEVKATSQRLDPKCWKGYRKQGTKVKGGVRVNNCVKVDEGEHCDAKNAVPELKAALEKRKTELKNASAKAAYDKIDKIMTRIAQTYNISGQELHDLWTERYGEIPDTWVLDEGKIANAALVAMLATVLSSGNAHADFNYPQQKEPSAAAKAIGIARTINNMKGYGPEAAQAEAQQELMNLLRALGNQGNNNSRIYPLIKDMVKTPGPLPTTVQELPPLMDQSTNEETYEGDEFYEAYGDLWFNEDEQLDEAEYHGRKVPLGKPMRGDVKKFKVYVKDPKTGNVKKVNFGDPNMRIKKSNPARRKSFRARHNCANPGPRTKARYWSCRKW